MSEENNETTKEKKIPKIKTGDVLLVSPSKKFSFMARVMKSDEIPKPGELYVCILEHFASFHGNTASGTSGHPKEGEYLHIKKKHIEKVFTSRNGDDEENPTIVVELLYGEIESICRTDGSNDPIAVCVIDQDTNENILYSVNAMGQRRIRTATEENEDTTLC